MTVALLSLALLPGIGPSDPRIGVDPSTMPWAAIGRLQIAGVARCTGVMVAPHWAVTAAHCLGIRVLGHLAPPHAVHLLLGYQDGRFGRHLVPDQIHVASETQADAMLPNMGLHRGRDFALLHFAEPSSDSLALQRSPLEPGVRLALGGYGQDRVERLAVDPDCAFHGYVGDRDRLPILVHGCAGTRGSSGGAVLSHDGSGWRLAGVQVAGDVSGAGGEAVPGFAVANQLDQLEQATGR